MPARAAAAKFAVPFHVCRLISFGGFPQDEIQRVFFAIKHGDAFTGMQFIERLARQLAIAWKFANREIDITVGTAVGQTFLLKLGDQTQHAADMVGGPGLGQWALNAQSIGILVQGLHHAVCQCANGLAVFSGTPDDFVVDVGDVAHVGDLQTRLLEPTLHHVERHHRTRMTHVAEVIHRHAAHIHPHMAWREWFQNLQLTRERVENSKGHGGWIGKYLHSKSA